MMELTIIGIKDHKWERTCWKGQIVPLEFKRSEIPGYEGRHAVEVYGKVLGLLPDDQQKLPFGCRVFATLHTYQNYVKAQIVDEPSVWGIPIFYDSPEDFSDEFLDKLDERGDWWNSMTTFRDECSPIHFYEWSIRTGIDINSVDLDTILRYLGFRQWLLTIQHSSEYSYGDEAIEGYKKYCMEEEQLCKAENAYLDWEFEKTESMLNMERVHR